MNFGLVQAGFLTGLLALAIPLIIHLLFRQKPRQIDLGSIRFLQQILDQSRSRRKVMRWMLMSLRMLGILLLALLFARPYVIARTKGTNGDELVAILIDRSASMQLKSNGRGLIELAVEQAKTLLKQADDKTQFEVAFFDHEVQPIVSHTASTLSSEKLLTQLRVPERSYSATDYAAAIRWAHDVCTNSNTEKKTLHIFTDLQQSGLAWSEVEPMPASVLVHVHDLGRDLSNNIAITSATPQRVVVRPGEATQVEVSFLNAGPFTVDELPVTLDVKLGTQTIHKRQKIKLEPGSIETVKFELPNLGAGLWQGVVQLESIDDMPFDNSRHFAVMSSPQYKVLVVDGDPHESEFLCETYHLQSALRLAPRGGLYSESPYFPKIAVGTESLSDFDIVVLANVSEVSTQYAERLHEFVTAGGGLLVFAGENITAKGYQAMAMKGLVPGKIIAARESFDLPWRISSWDETHSIFEPFNDPQHGDLRRLAFRGITEMIPDKRATVVAILDDGKPFLLEKQIGKAGGAVLWMTTSCDLEWGNWAQERLFLPIVHQMLGHLTGLNAGGPVREAVIDTPTEGLASTVPGVFAQQRSWQVVNVSPRESETARCTVHDFVSRFELNIAGDDASEATVQMASVGNALAIRQDEIWHWILFALVAVGITELLIANRTTL